MQSSTVDTPILEIEDLTVRFGGVIAVNGLSLRVRRGQICGLVGPNGAGKTTVFNTVARQVSATNGDVRFNGRSILNIRPARLAAMGIRRTFQNLALFESQDVWTNALIGGHSRGRAGWLAGIVRVGTAGEERQLEERAHTVLEFLDLAEVRHARVADLPFGTLKRVELARALVSSPDLILLDEPANGLREAEVQELKQVLFDIRDHFETTLIVVDHHVRLILALCDTVAAMGAGQLLACDTPERVWADPDVRTVFLGEAA